MSSAINDAVIDLCARGKLSATSVMVRRSAWLRGAPQLRRMPAACIEVGLHFDLTPPPREGVSEPGLAGLLARAFTRTAPAAALQADIREQFMRFEDAMGRAPAFVDGHRHVHQLPVVRELLLDEIVRRYPASPPWVRSTRPGWRHGADRWKAEAIHALGGAGLAAQAEQRGVPMSLRLLGVYGFTADVDAYRARLREWLGAARDGDVLMCHPASTANASDPHAGARAREYEALKSLELPRQFAIEPATAALDFHGTDSRWIEKRGQQGDE